MDASVPAIAHHDAAPQLSPYVPVEPHIARQWRLYYMVAMGGRAIQAPFSIPFIREKALRTDSTKRRLIGSTARGQATIAWMDSQLGRVMDELDALGHHDDTLVVLHADHGWSLGEHGDCALQYAFHPPICRFRTPGCARTLTLRDGDSRNVGQKFTNWELGARVPLIMRAPWLAGSVGKRTTVLAELIDIFPTSLVSAPVERCPGRHGHFGRHDNSNGSKITV
jgi:hypothetical protein